MFGSALRGVVAGRLRLSVLFAVGLVVFAACAPAAPAAVAKTDIIVTSPFIPTTLDPMIDSVPYSEIKLIMDPLFLLTADMKVQPGLATEWKALDATTWELKLRSGVKFHNGDPFTAMDVKFNFDRILDPATNSRQVPVYYTKVKSVQVVDDLTVRITTNGSWPALPQLLSFMRIAPAKYFQSVGAEAFAQKPVGTGPYKFVEWVKDAHVTLEANDAYWRGAPKIKRVTFSYVPDGATRVAQLLSGSVDLVQSIAPSDAARVKATSDLELASIRGMNGMFVGINTFVKPFNDVRVRQALNYAVNWDAIISTLLGGYAFRNASTIGALTNGYDPNLKPYAYDPAKAKQLLAEAGYPNGFATTLDGPIGRYNQDKEVAQAVVADLAKVGVQVQYVGAEFNAFFTKFLGDAKLPMNTGERGRASSIQGLYLLGCANTTGGDFDLCNQLYFNSKVRGIYYNSPDVDALLNQEGAEINPDARLGQARALEQVLQQNAPWIFGYDEAKLFGYKKGLTFDPRPDDFFDAYAATWQ